MREQEAGIERSQDEGSEARDGRAQQRRPPRGCEVAAARGSRSEMNAAEADATTRQRLPAGPKNPRTASTSAPRTHHRELRNGGGRGEEPGRRARRSQSMPPASFGPATKTAEGVGSEGESGAGPRSMRKPSANRSAVGGHWRRRAGTQGPRPGKRSALLPPCQPPQQNKGGSASQTAPEEASTRRAGG